MLTERNTFVIAGIATKNHKSDMMKHTLTMTVRTLAIAGFSSAGNLTAVRRSVTS